MIGPGSKKNPRECQFWSVGNIHTLPKLCKDPMIPFVGLGWFLHGVWLVFHVFFVVFLFFPWVFMIFGWSSQYFTVLGFLISFCAFSWFQVGISSSLLRFLKVAYLAKLAQSSEVTTQNAQKESHNQGFSLSRKMITSSSCIQTRFQIFLRQIILENESTIQESVHHIVN